MSRAEETTMTDLGGTAPNRYGMAAWRHARRNNSGRVLAMEDPARVFTELGERLAEAVLEVEDRLLAAQSDDVGFEETLSQRRQARLAAEEIVMSEMGFSPPELDLLEPETDETGAWVGPTPGMGEWVSVLAGPDPEDDPVT
jgi:hypothetical protein